MTTFELLVVIMLITAVGMIALPQLMAVREDYRLRATAGQVAGVMNEARIRAITGNTDYRVNVATADSYLVQRDNSGTWTTEFTYDLPVDFSFSTSGSIIEFHPRGNATPASTLTLQNPNGTTRDVVVELSGRAYAQ